MDSTGSVGEPDRVLVVDDNTSIRTLLRRLIEDWGYACAEAEDGVTALDYATTHDIALLVTDLDMPRLDGIGLIRALRESERQKRCPPVLAILVTGSATGHVPAAAKGMDIVAVLPKPVETLVLRTLVTRLLPRAEAIDSKSLARARDASADVPARKLTPAGKEAAATVRPAVNGTSPDTGGCEPDARLAPD